jgi:hypothetical protein
MLHINKRAQGLSLNTVIIAVTVIIVLVVIIVIFTRGMAGFSGELPSCASKGGYCEADCGANNYPVRNTDCDETGLLCCVPMSQTDGSKCRAMGGVCHGRDGVAPNLESKGRLDCAPGEGCYVNSPCADAGYTCTQSALACPAGQTRQNLRCRSYPDNYVCCG